MNTKFFFLGRVFMDLDKEAITLRQFLAKEIFGVGKAITVRISGRIGIPLDIPFNRLGFSSQRFRVFLTRIERHLNRWRVKTGFKLKRYIQTRIHHEIRNGTIYGFRFVYGLPIRGQRTHTNASTQKRLFRGKYFFKDSKKAKRGTSRAKKK